MNYFIYCIYSKHLSLTLCSSCSIYRSQFSNTIINAYCLLLVLHCFRNSNKDKNYCYRKPCIKNARIEQSKNVKPYVVFIVCNCREYLHQMFLYKQWHSLTNIPFGSNCTGWRKNRPLATVSEGSATIFLPVSSRNAKRVSQFFYCETETHHKFVTKLLLKIPPHHKIVATLTCEMYDTFLNSQTRQWPGIYCVSFHVYTTALATAIEMH